MDEREPHLGRTRRHHRQCFIDLLSDNEIDVISDVCDRILANLSER